MLNGIKNLFAIIISHIKFYGAIRGLNVAIRSSVVSSDVSIFNHVTIHKSLIGRKTLIYNYSNILGSTLKGNNRIGRYCALNNSTLEDFSYIADGSAVNNAQIGKYSSIGPGVKIGFGGHPTNHISSSPYFYSSVPNLEMSFNEYERTYIGNDVWIGANVYLKDGVRIGDGAIIAAGAIVVNDVEDYCIVGGVPARFIKFRHSREVVECLKGINWWQKDEGWITKNISLFRKPITTIDDLFFKD